MKKKLLAVTVTLVLMLGSTVPVFAGPIGGIAPPPVPLIATSLGLCLTDLQFDLSTAYDPGEDNCLLPDAF